MWVCSFSDMGRAGFPMVNLHLTGIGADDLLACHPPASFSRQPNKHVLVHLGSYIGRSLT
jgi:hypothetical protein